MATREWVTQAACAGLDTNIFFPADDRARDHREYALARSICATCPVSQDCLRYAIEEDIPNGMWGGMSRRQRVTYYKANRSMYSRTFIQMKHGTRAMYRKELDLAKQGGPRPCEECRAANARQKLPTI